MPPFFKEKYSLLFGNQSKRSRCVFSRHDACGNTGLFIRTEVFGIEVGIRLDVFPRKQLVAARWDSANSHTAIVVGRRCSILIRTIPASQIRNEDDLSFRKRSTL